MPFGKFYTLKQLQQHYQQRFGLPYACQPKVVCNTTSSQPPILVVVIPAFAEPNPELPLLSMLANKPPCAVQIVYVFNYGQQTCSTEKETTAVGMLQLLQAIKSYAHQPQIGFTVLSAFDLPPKHAGVGLARKIGMDYAFNLFCDNNTNGLIVTTDADSTLHPNYLTQAYQWHQAQAQVVHFNFLHPAAHKPLAANNADHAPPIAYYELFLRYYVAGLRYAQYPYWYHTIGSCMGVRAAAYALAGGMNKRKAGEDFYFLHKLYPKAQVGIGRQAMVYPSDRVGNRVPFGTGRAMQQWQQGDPRHAFFYNPKSFFLLKSLVAYLKQLPSVNNTTQATHLPAELQPIENWLAQEGFYDRVGQLCQQYATRPHAMVEQLFVWLDGFRVRKLMHYLRDAVYPNMPAQQAAEALLQAADPNFVPQQPGTINQLVALFYEKDAAVGQFFEKNH